MKKVFLSTMILAIATTSTFATPIQGDTLTTATAATLTQDQCASLVGVQGIPLSVIPVLPNVCINNTGLQFSNAQLDALTSAQISSLSLDWLRGAGPARQALLLDSASSDAVFRIFALGTIPTAKIQVLTSAQLKGLTATQFSLIPSNYLTSLTQAQMRDLGSDKIAVEFNTWTDAQMQKLTPAQISGIPAYLMDQMASYTSGWDSTRIQALTPAQLADIPEYFGYPWFPTVFAKMTASQIASISDQAFINLAKNRASVQKVPTSRVSTLKTETIVTLARTGLIKNLSSQQIAALSVSSARWLKRRGLTDSLSRSQLDSLPSTDFKLRVTVDQTCTDFGFDLGDLQLDARYTTEYTAPRPSDSTDISSGTYQAVSVDTTNGNFALPYTATYVYFYTVRRFTGLPNFAGMRNTPVFKVTDGGIYSPVCRNEGNH